MVGAGRSVLSVFAGSSPGEAATVPVMEGEQNSGNLFFSVESQNHWSVIELLIYKFSRLEKMGPKALAVLIFCGSSAFGKKRSC